MEQFRRHGGRLRSGAGALVVSLAVAAAVTGGYFGLRHDAASGDTSGAPAARVGAAMAYDPATGDVVMFGGEGASGQPLVGTWLWNGSAWSVAAPAESPPARYGALMAWDPQSQRVILLGGMGGSGCATGDRGGSVAFTGSACTQLQDAWAWNGSDWAEVDLGVSAGQLGYYSLEGASMATDPASGRIVLVTDNSPASQVIQIPGMNEASGEASGGAAAATATAVAGSSGAGGICIGVDGGPCGSPVPLPSDISVPPVETACPLTVGCTSPACPTLPAASQGGVSGDIACPLPCASTAIACGICPVTSGGAVTGPASQVICSNCPIVDTPCPLLAATLTWVFDGSSFEQVQADPASSPSSGGDLVWFPGPGSLVDLGPGVYSAIGTTVDCPDGAPCPVRPVADDWAWTGTGWTPVDVLTSGAATPFFEVPPVADLSAGDVVGVDSSGATWTSTEPASGWVKASPTASPAARSDFALAFDGATGEAVLFGGDLLAASSAGAQVVGDTWTWDGTDWTEQGGTAPSPTPSGSAAPVPSAVDLPALGSPMSTPSASASTATTSTAVPSVSASPLPDSATTSG
jgi:hypothetical protein